MKLEHDMYPNEIIEENLAFFKSRLARRSLYHARQHNEHLEQEVHLGYFGFGAGDKQEDQSAQIKYARSEISLLNNGLGRGQSLKAC